MSRKNIIPEEKAVAKIVEIVKPKEPLPEIVYGAPNLPKRCYAPRQCYEVKAMLKMLERGEPGMTLKYPDQKGAERASSRIRCYIYKQEKKPKVKVEQRGRLVGITVLGRVMR